MSNYHVLGMGFLSGRKSGQWRFFGVCLVGFLFFPAVLSGQYEASFLDNNWYWTPASGAVEFYEVQLSYDDGDTWESVATDVPPDTQDYGRGQEVRHTIVSAGAKDYHIRVRALGAEGRQGPWSEISSVRFVGPGKPILGE